MLLPVLLLQKDTRTRPYQKPSIQVNLKTGTRSSLKNSPETPWTLYDFLQSPDTEVDLLCTRWNFDKAPRKTPGYRLSFSSFRDYSPVSYSSPALHSTESRDWKDRGTPDYWCARFPTPLYQYSSLPRGPPRTSRRGGRDDRNESLYPWSLLNFRNDAYEDREGGRGYSDSYTRGSTTEIVTCVRPSLGRLVRL